MMVRPRLLAALVLAAGVAGTEDATTALAVIAMGRLASEALFGMCVRSIRGKGQYSGRVYALTDMPECAPADVTVVPVRVQDRCLATHSGSILRVSSESRVGVFLGRRRSPTRAFQSRAAGTSS